MLRLHAFVCAAAIVSAASACKQKQDEGADPQPTTPTTSPTATPPRVAPFRGAALGPQHGYIDGGLVYAAMRVDQIQAFAQKLPLPPDAARELAEAGAVFGLDFRVDDVRARFGIAPSAVVSMTIARPLAADAEALRTDLTRGGPFLDALAMPDTPPPEPPKVEISYRPSVAPPTAAAEPVPEPEPPPAATAVPEIAKPPPGEPRDDSWMPEPARPAEEPRPSLEAVAQAQKFLRKATTLGTHSRIHIPAADPTVLGREVKRLGSRGEIERWGPLCRAIPAASVCVGPSDMVVIVREGKASVDVDIIQYGAPGAADAPGRIAAAREAALTSSVKRDGLSALEGDAAVFVDLTAVQDLVTVDAVSGAIQSMEWTAHDDRRATIARRLEKIEAIRKLADAPMLYRGVALEAVDDGTKVAARLRWQTANDQEKLAASLLRGPDMTVDVPTVAALCEGAVACARTRGLPTPSAWRDKLATGVYAESQRDLQRTLGRADEWAALLVLAGAWPNLAGAMTRWPAQEIGAGPEAAIANNVVEALGDIEGFGGSLRSVAPGVAGALADYAVYARAKRAEVDLARTLLTFAELSPADTAISGIEGKAQMVRLPVHEVAASVVLYPDPDPQYGWAALVDGPDRMAWLLGLPRDRSAAPSAYLEIPDLWRLASAHPEVARELGFARTFLAGRQLRIALSIEDGAPHFTAATEVATTAKTP